MALMQHSRRQVAQLLGAPPGVVPNYIDPYSRGQQIVITGIVLSSVALIFVTARVLVKLVLTKHFGWDDIFALGALGFSIARTVLGCVLVDTYGIGVHIWDFNPIHIIGAHNIQFIEDMVYLLGIMCAKLSILFFYQQIFTVKRGFRWLCYGMMVTTVVYCLIFFFIIAFDCKDEYFTWHFSFTAKCIEITNITVAIGAVNIVTDLIIMVMPLPLIWKLQLTTSRKWGLLAVFSTGLFVFVSTIVREVIVVRTDKELDQSWQVVDEVVWLTIELNVAIISISLPMLSPLYNRILSSNFGFTSLRHLLSTSFRSRSKSGSTYGETDHTKEATSHYNDSVYLVSMAPSDTTRQGGTRDSGDRQNYMGYATPEGGIRVKNEIAQNVSTVDSRGGDIV